MCRHWMVRLVAPPKASPSVCSKRGGGTRWRSAGDGFASTPNRSSKDPGEVADCKTPIPSVSRLAMIGVRVEMAIDRQAIQPRHCEFSTKLRLHEPQARTTPSTRSCLRFQRRRKSRKSDFPGSKNQRFPGAQFKRNANPGCVAIFNDFWESVCRVMWAWGEACRQS